MNPLPASIKQKKLKAARGLVAATIISLALFIISSCSNPDSQNVKQTSNNYLEAVANQNCAEVRALTAPDPQTDPCEDLANRAFKLSGIPVTGSWKTKISNQKAASSIELADNIEYKLNLIKLSGKWLVLYP